VESIEEHVIAIVADRLGKDKSQVRRDSSFTSDLGADSLDLVELTMEFEDKFGITIADEDQEKIQTVGQAIDYVKEHVR
jgi:acyl carrier protein